MTRLTSDSRASSDAPGHIIKAHDVADLVFSRREVTFAIDQVAMRMAAHLYDENPLFICVLQGGFFYFSRLIERLNIPLEVSYVHVGRYGEKTIGNSELTWLAKPHVCLEDRHVVLVDDVFDKGVTMKSLVDWAWSEGASVVSSSVLISKETSKVKDAHVDFMALHATDRFLFGCGMDYRGYWRNLPEVFALPEGFVG